ncbi:MAG: cobalamin biosynthesis protein CbiX [Planctomycetota bacterium]|nr:MAG: cobalamin biosynthesis protein CbiX [Planctomycetota bacterium]
MQQALVLVAHGSRRREANEDLQRLADQLAGRVGPDVAVRWAYLELAAPSIPEALQCAAADGARQVVIAPVFLSAGRHVQEDIRRIAADFRRHFPHIDLRIAAPIGLHPKLADIVWDRVQAAVRDADHGSGERPAAP